MKRVKKMETMREGKRDDEPKGGGDEEKHVHRDGLWGNWRDPFLGFFRFPF